MEVTSVFNAAANGEGGSASNVGACPSASGGGGGSNPRAAAYESVGSATYAGPTAEFRGAANPGQQVTAEGREFTLSDARAELEMLEAGRPAPSPENNLKPPPMIARAVQSEVEVQRETRIMALKAFLETSLEHDKATPEVRPETSLEPSF